MEDRYIGLQIAGLVFTMMFTVIVHAQRQQGGVIVQSTAGVSQETRDALQDAQLNQLVSEVVQQAKAIGELKEKMDEANGALQRLNTTGYTFGALLSLLLAADLYFRVRNSILMKIGPK